MKAFRIVVGVLAIVPVAMIVDAVFLHPYNYGPGSLGELAYPVFGMPILILNMWAWARPEIIEFYFFGKKDGES